MRKETERDTDNEGQKRLSDRGWEKKNERKGNRERPTSNRQTERKRENIKRKKMKNV